jgi:hypothetical protein
MSLSEVIKNRGKVIDEMSKKANFNDIIDERYAVVRKDIKKNLNHLDHAIRAEPKLFEFSFKRSLVNHIKERKRMED